MLDIGIIEYENVFSRYDVKAESAVSPEELFEELAPEEEPWKSMAEDVVFLNPDGVESKVKEALEDYDPQEVINNGLIGGMDVVSELYGRGIYFLPQLVIAGDAMSNGITLCEEKLAESGEERETPGKVVMHVAEGDPHDIGKDIAAAMLKAAGYEVIDMGRDVAVEDVVDMVKEESPDLLTGTALMTTTQTAFPRVAKRLAEEGIELPFIGAGGAVNSAYVHSFDCGIYADDAADGPAIADAITQKGMTWQDLREEYDDIVPSAV
ncbi:MAG: Methanogenic corrinoid protein MtaC [Candidatus Methanohalarchaeum thermophilum]|uniref:Methanogenic corrinoid protein MtaC n=1 Tax=Methanohalarchaeum thermophilum TaxID=1903181 RepID=A0A1Q6DVM8_METT1|nr:MAG: Methanogenic corrinoid protein MtaC [Candidatus Methanohalarchaeum thermophilum]